MAGPSPVEELPIEIIGMICSYVFDYRPALARVAFKWASAVEALVGSRAKKQESVQVVRPLRWRELVNRGHTELCIMCPARRLPEIVAGLGVALGRRNPEVVKLCWESIDAVAKEAHAAAERFIPLLHDLAKSIIIVGRTVPGHVARAHPAKDMMSQATQIHSSMVLSRTTGG